MKISVSYKQFKINYPLMMIICQMLVRQYSVHFKEATTFQAKFQPPAPQPCPNNNNLNNNLGQTFHAQVNSFFCLLSAQVSDPSHVLVWAGCTHYGSINRVAEKNEMDFYICIIPPLSVPKRKGEISRPSLTLGI
jgi:hypothetical protein